MTQASLSYAGTAGRGVADEIGAVVVVSVEVAFAAGGDGQRRAAAEAGDHVQVLNTPAADGIVTLQNSYGGFGIRPRQMQLKARLEW